MEFAIDTIEDIAVVALDGENLDASNSKDFRDRLKERLGDCNRVVLDMGRTSFVDSSGCGVLLATLRKLNAEGGDMKMCNVSKSVRALFELIRMHRIFDIYNTRDEAIRAFHG